MKEYEFKIANSINPTSIKKNDEFIDFPNLILSQLLYVSYLIFFSPYLLKLLSFLSPLFITTSLLILSLLTTLVPLNLVLTSKDISYNTLSEDLSPKFINGGDRSQSMEGLEAYKIVFETPKFQQMEENPVDSEENKENSVVFSKEKFVQLEYKTGDQCESLKIGIETGDVIKPNIVKERVKKFESFLNRNVSEEGKQSINEAQNTIGISMKLDDSRKFVDEFSQTVGRQPLIGRFGKNREWKRTLACKLLEERYNSSDCRGVINDNNEERMDMLWETLETESNRRKTEEVNNHKKINHDEDEDEDEYDNEKICCLQALKLSAGKISLSMGRSSLIKFGKALQSHIRRKQRRRSCK